MTFPFKRIAVGVVALLAGAAAVGKLMEAPPDRPPDFEANNRTRAALFAEIQPIALANCTLERLGERNDGGYLVCGNLLGDVEAAYSYGINGYDGWGCDVARRLRVKVHQYDCFETTEPSCQGGDTMFHAECIGPTPLDNGRQFDTLEHQIARNGDAGERLLVKMDVEGAEWDTFLTTPAEVLGRVDQLVIEFHGTNDIRFIAAMRRLKEQFYVAYWHFNNYGCDAALAPFPSRAYELLLVNKKIGIPDTSGKTFAPSPLDAPNYPGGPDCQPGRK